MGGSAESTWSEDSTTHLLRRLSEDFLPSSPESFSDYYDDSSTDYAPFENRRPSTRRKGWRWFVLSLSHSPLGITRRKTKSKKKRAFACFFNFVLIVTLACLGFAFYEAIFRPSYGNPPAHYKALSEAVRASDDPGRGNPRNEKIFISSNIIQPDMIRGPWGDSVLKLIDILGPQNVFVSIYENDSGPETILALSWLREQLKCEYNIVFGDHLSLDDFPTVILPNGEARVKRITYLAEVRNKLLKPLDEAPILDPSWPLSTLALNHTATRFDRMLFINDIYFKPEDALNLLFSTNLNHETGVAEYRAACSMDFIRGGTLYDSFVIRDTDGQEIATPTYPWFSTFGSATSRNDVLAQKDAVRVTSCWSGMAAYEATPFLRKAVIDANPITSHLEPYTSSPANASGASLSVPAGLNTDLSPLKFRHQSDIFWEASECCLINADIQARYPGEETGMFLNPFVRVAYDEGTWKWQPWIQRFERGLVLINWFSDKLRFAQEGNPRLNQVVGKPTTVMKWMYDIDALNGERMRNGPEYQALGLKFPLSPDQTTGQWTSVQEVATPGGYCGQKRVFVMLTDLQKANRGKSGRNWQKLPIPL